MVDLLVLLQTFVDGFLDGADGPVHAPLAIIVLVVIDACLNVSKAVVFQCESDNFDVTRLQEEVVTTVLRRVRPYRDRVFVGAEDEEVFLYFPAKLHLFIHFGHLTLLFFLISSPSVDVPLAFALPTRRRNLRQATVINPHSVLRLQKVWQLAVNGVLVVCLGILWNRELCVVVWALISVFLTHLAQIGQLLLLLR